MRIVESIIGFCVGFAVVVGLEVLLFVLLQEIFDARLIPRGIGWIVMPIAGGVLGWKAAPLLTQSGRLALATSKNLRVFLAMSFVWMLAVSGYFLVFNPYGRYWSEDEYIQFSSIFGGPPLLGAVAFLALAWAVREQKL